MFTCWQCCLPADRKDERIPQCLIDAEEFLDRRTVFYKKYIMYSCPVHCTKYIVDCTVIKSAVLSQLCTMITRKLYNGKTTFTQNWSAFNVVTNQITIIILLNHLLTENGLFTLHNCYVSCSLDYLKSQLFLFQSFLWLLQ